MRPLASDQVVVALMGVRPGLVALPAVRGMATVRASRLTASDSARLAFRVTSVPAAELICANEKVDANSTTALTATLENLKEIIGSFVLRKLRFL